MAPQKTLNVINLENQFNVRFPHRDKASDGWIGDETHKLRRSGHNPDDTPGSKPAWDGDPDSLQEVRDKDLDSDLGEPGTTMDDVVTHLIQVPRFSTVCRYLIWNGHWWHADTGFEKRVFDGDPHTEHLHYEGAWTQTADNNISFNFRLDDIPMPEVDLSRKAIQDLANKIGLDLSRSEQGSGIAKGLRENVSLSVDERLDRIDAALATLLSRPVAPIDRATIIDVFKDAVASLPD